MRRPNAIFDSVVMFIVCLVGMRQTGLDLVARLTFCAGVRRRLSHDAEKCHKRAFGVSAAFARDDSMESPAPCHVTFCLLYVSNAFKRDNSMKFSVLSEGVDASSGCQPVDHSPVEYVADLHR